MGNVCIENHFREFAVKVVARRRHRRNQRRFDTEEMVQ